MNLLSRVGQEHFNNTPIDQLLQEDFDYEDCWERKDHATVCLAYVLPNNQRYGSCQVIHKSFLVGKEYRAHRSYRCNHICIDVMVEADWKPEWMREK
jgi:hypothetical protein